MMDVLLDLAGRPKGRGIRPHSLKVETIYNLMTDIIIEQADLSQLEIQGNYRAATAQDMAKSIRETSQNNNLPGPILPNPRSAQTRIRSLLKLTRRSSRGTHVQAISSFPNRNLMALRLTIGR